MEFSSVYKQYMLIFRKLKNKFKLDINGDGEIGRVERLLYFYFIG